MSDDRGPRQTGNKNADWLRRIAHELRESGNDHGLVLLDETGVGDAGITLADELELVALAVDGEGQP